MKSKKGKEKMLLLKWIAIIWGFSARLTHKPLTFGFGFGEEKFLE